VKRPRFITLNTKLAIAIIPLVLLFMAFNFWIILSHERRILELETEKRATSLATGLSILSAEAQRTFSEYQLQQNVSQFSQLPHVISVAIIDSHGRILAHNVAQMRGKMLDGDAQKVASGAHGEHLRYRAVSGQRVLEVYTPIYVDPEKKRRTGTVLIALSLNGLERALQKSQSYLMGLTFLLLSGATLFVGLLARWFTAPLMRLTSVSQELSRGNFGVRAQISSNDEVGVLAGSLNLMAQRIESMIDQEKNARQKLQKRVSGLLEFTDRVVSGELSGQAEAGEDDEMGRLTLAVNEMVRHLRIILEDERSVRENLEKSRADLEQANLKLKELDQMKSEFLNTVSHELRTPLTSIKAFAEILIDNEGEDVETQMEFLGIINKESDRLTRLINNLLDLSRIEAGRMNWHFGNYSVNELVKGACEVLRLSAEKKDVELKMDLQEAASSIYADEDKMTQVLTNLVGNALKFTPTGGTITVKTWNEGTYVCISVRDSGLGIAPEHHGRIFEKFGQVDTSETREIKGSGLGLPIAKSIVEAHKGTISVASELGQGSTFMIRLDNQADVAVSAASGDEPAVVKPPVTAAPIDPHVQRRVLIVDDEINIRRFLRHTLEQESYDVLEAASGQEALARAVRERPHLILLDLRLPDMTGFEILEELKKKADTRNIPVIILSIIQDQQEGYRLGASDFLNKPVDRERLVERIDRLLGPRSANQSILVVEDDDSIRKAIEVILTGQGFAVTTVGSAEEAQKELQSLSPNLILLDLGLPGMQGNQFLREIRAQEGFKGIPVIVLTAAGPEERQAALLGGAKEVVGKPFSEESLAALIRGTLTEAAQTHT
jgi:signal transduction histidine kinase/DNA-binding response OmpR family regulator